MLDSFTSGPFQAQILMILLYYLYQVPNLCGHNPARAVFRHVQGAVSL